jgi:MFS family permease
MELSELDNTTRKSHHPSSSNMSSTQNPLPDPPAETTSKKLSIIIGSLYLGTSLVVLDTTIIGTALPAITSEFHAFDYLAWYGSVYLLTLTALQPTFEKLYKIMDTRYLYLGSIVVFEGMWPVHTAVYMSLMQLVVGSVLCVTTQSSPMFISGRAVAGCGAAGLMQG